MDFGYNEQNMAVYNGKFLELLRHKKDLYLENYLK
jgi:hypothetical protein